MNFWVVCTIAYLLVIQMKKLLQKGIIFFALIPQDPDPGSGFQIWIRILKSHWIRIRIHNPALSKS
jgi:hypothetical protein